jgi:hypothetical protein
MPEMMHPQIAQTSQSSAFSPSPFDGEKVAEGRMRGLLLMHRGYNTRPGTS